MERQAGLADARHRAELRGGGRGVVRLEPVRGHGRGQGEPAELGGQLVGAHAEDVRRGPGGLEVVGLPRDQAGQPHRRHVAVGGRARRRHQVPRRVEHRHLRVEQAEVARVHRDGQGAVGAGGHDHPVVVHVGRRGDVGADGGPAVGERQGRGRREGVVERRRVVGVRPPRPVHRLDAGDVVGVRPRVGPPQPALHHRGVGRAVVEPDRVAELVHQDRGEVGHRADRQGAAGAQLDVAGRRRAPGVPAHAQDAGAHVVPADADVAEPGVPLGQARGALRRAVVGDEVEVQVGHVRPRLQRPRHLALPRRLRVRGVVNGEQVARVAGGDQRPVRHEADGHVRVRPGEAGQGVGNRAVLELFHGRPTPRASRREPARRRPPKK